VQISDTTFDHRDQRGQVRAPGRHDFDRVRYGGRQLHAVDDTSPRDHVVLVPDLSEFQRIIMVNVSHGGLVLETGHQTAGPNRALLDVVVRLVSVARPVIRRPCELDQVHEQINLRLGAQEHGLHRRAAEAGQVFRRGRVPLFPEHEIVVCNNGGRPSNVIARGLDL